MNLMGSDGAAGGLQNSLTRMAVWISTVTLLLAAAWLFVAAPEQFPVAGRLEIALTALAIIILGLRFFSAVDLQSVPYFAVSAALLLVLLTKWRNDFQGWWPVVELLALAAVLVIPAISALTARWLAILGVLLAIAWEALGNSSVGSLYQTPIAGAGALSRLALIALVVEAGTLYLRRYATSTDQLEAESAAAMAVTANRERVEQNQRVARRVLHDTIVNTLEAISMGLPAASRPALEEQCRSDTRRWYQLLDSTAWHQTDPFQQALAQAEGWGLSLNVTRNESGLPPPEVTQEVAAAMLEALRNVRKHADSDSARIVIELTATSCEVQVLDSGRGFATRESSGFGVASSIHGRMQDVGGSASVASEPKGGTSVRLTWREPSVEEPFQMATDLRNGVVRGGWLLVALAFGASTVAVLLDWYAMPRPVIWLACLTVIAGVLFWLLRRAGEREIRAGDWWLPATTLVAVSLLWPVADQFCSAASTQALVPDLRILLLVIPAILLPNIRAVSTALVAATVASAIAGWWWSQSWSECQLTPVPSLLAAVLVTSAALTFGLELRRQETLAQRAARERMTQQQLAAVQKADQATARYWTTPITDQAVAILQAVADGRVDPDQVTTRHQAGSAASNLRAMVLIAGIGGSLGEAIRDVATQTHQAGHQVVLRGPGEGISLASAESERWAAALRKWSGSKPTGDLTVTVAVGPRWSSVLVHRAGRVPEIGTDLGPDIDCWFEEDGAWWHAEQGVESVRGEASLTLESK